MPTATLARANDPLTSLWAAASVAGKTANMQDSLLAAFALDKKGMIAQDAAYEADLLHTGYWKRVSELLKSGYLEDTGHTEVAQTTGRRQRVLRITADGRDRLKDVKARFRRGN